MYTQKEKHNQRIVSQPSTCSSFPRTRESRQLEAFKQESFERSLEDLSRKNFPNRTKNGNVTTSINLKNMSNDQLLLQTKSLVQKERQINTQVLQHLQD